MFLAFEIATVLLYLLEMSFCFHTISWYKNLDCVDDDVLRRKDLKIKQSVFFKNKQVQVQNRNVCVNLIALLPLSLITDGREINMMVVVGLCSLRLIKVGPIFKFFQQKQKDRLAEWRIFATVYFFYMISHWFANIMILMAYWEDDWTQNWLKKCPVP